MGTSRLSISLIFLFRSAHLRFSPPLLGQIIRSGHTTADSTTTQSSWWQYTDNDVQVASEMVVLIKPREFVGETHQTPVWNLPENRINDLVHEIYEQIPDCLRNMYCSVLTADNEEIGYYDYGQLHRMLTQLLVPTATIAIYVGRV